MTEEKISLLLVDDEQDILYVIKKRLEVRQYDVTTVNSGRKALEVVKNNHFDLILLDVMMPQMDGFETCCHLKADPSTSKIPIIMFTSLNDKTSVIQAVKMGASDYCIKSADIDDLLAKINRAYAVNASPKFSKKLEVRNKTDDKKFFLDRAKVDRLVKKYENLSITEDATITFDNVFNKKIIDDNVLITALSLYPLMAVKIIQMANGESNSKKRIKTLQDLIRIKGISNVRRYVELLIRQQKSFSKNIPQAINYKGYRIHSLVCAHFAKVIAKTLRYDDPELVYVSALFHDLGEIVLANSFPEEYQKSIELAEKENLPIRDAEKKIFGIDHAFVAFRLFDIWEFPKEIQFSVFHHHHSAIHLSNGQKKLNEITRIIYIADLLCNAAGIGAARDIVLEEIPSSIWEFMSLNHNRLLEMIHSTCSELNGQMILFKLDDMPLQWNPELNERCLGRECIVFHNSADVVNLLSIALSMRGAEVTRVDSLESLSQALELNESATLILSGRAESGIIPLEHPLVKPHVKERSIVMLLSKGERRESSFEQVQFLYRPVSLTQVLEVSQW